MAVLREIIPVLRKVWRQFLDDAGFALSVAAVFSIVALMMALEASAELICATIALGCLTIAMEFKLNRRD
jgi:hypothetical protein